MELTHILLLTFGSLAVIPLIILAVFVVRCYGTARSLFLEVNDEGLNGIGQFAQIMGHAVASSVISSLKAADLGERGGKVTKSGNSVQGLEGILRGGGGSLGERVVEAIIAGIANRSLVDGDGSNASQNPVDFNKYA